MIGSGIGSLVTRRSFVALGTCGLLSLPGWRPALAAGKRARARSVLVLFEQGGVSQMDTFDPKPDAPAEHRTPFGTIETAAPGMRFTSLLTRTAAHADKLTVVRCMTQPKPGIGNSHPLGSQYVFSGEAPGGAEVMPDIGSRSCFRDGILVQSWGPNSNAP